MNRILELVDMMLKIDSSSSQATYETVLSLYEMIVQEKVVDVIGSDSKMVSAVDTVRASKAMKLIVYRRAQWTTLHPQARLVCGALSTQAPLSRSFSTR